MHVMIDNTVDTDAFTENEVTRIADFLDHVESRRPRRNVDVRVAQDGRDGRLSVACAFIIREPSLGHH